jgi:hypothetical protein
VFERKGVCTAVEKRRMPSCYLGCGCSAMSQYVWHMYCAIIVTYPCTHACNKTCLTATVQPSERKSTSLDSRRGDCLFSYISYIMCSHV